MERKDFIEQIDVLIKDLCDSRALVEPEMYAGYLLVDPVVPAAISYWWDKYKQEFPNG